MLTLGSLFDGIGGFPLAGTPNGIMPVWASEIEAFPIEVTKIRFPDMVHVGDITKLDGAKLPPVDVICGGSPCQDLSVAGQRRGLAGERSGLFMEQVRIVKEMRDADEQRNVPAHLVRPRYLVWENVPGAFSSADGEDFRAVLEEIVRIKDNACHVPRPDAGRWESAGGIVLGDQFSLAWRVLDAQYWGVAQRRRRIFLVADFGGLTAPEILFKQDGLSGNPAPGGSTGQGAAAPAQGGADAPGGACLTPWDVQSRRIFEESGTWPALYGGEGGGHGYIKTEKKTKEIFAFHINQREETIDLGGVSGALLATRNMQMQTFIAEQEKPPMLCLNDQGGDRMDITEEVTSTLRAGMGGHPPLVAQPNCLNGWDTQQSRVFTPDGVSPTLAGAEFAAGVVSKGDGGCFLTPEIHTSLTSGGGQAGQGYPCVFTAGFCGNAGASARGIGFQPECSPTLKTGTAPSVLCLNDQGGSVMACSEDVTGTLRAQEHGHQPLVFDNHGQDARFKGPVKASQTVSAGFGMGGNNQPLVLATQQGGAELGAGVCPAITATAGMNGNNQPVLFENHGIDARYTGPHPVAPTMSVRYGTGGNNVPLIQQEAESICIAGNIIDRKPENGGNGFGYQTGVAYTLTGMDRHAVFSRQRVDAFRPDEVASTESARQYKDATDLVMETAGLDCRNGTENGDLCGTLQGGSAGSSLNAVHPVRTGQLIRRLTPLECERLQGFPDHWTDIPGASDSARYKALGNSVAIPCVDFVLRGIAYFLHKIKKE